VFVGLVSGPDGMRLQFIARTEVVDPQVKHICPPHGHLRVIGRFPLTKTGVEVKLSLDLDDRLTPPEMALQIKARLLPTYADFLAALKSHGLAVENFEEVDHFLPPLPEREVASAFVRCIFEEAGDAWADVYEALRAIGGKHFAVKDGTLARVHFALAATSLGLQAVKNLYPADQASRIELCVYSELKEGNDIEVVKRHSAAYQQASLHGSNPLEPVSVVAARLLHHWLGENIRDLAPDIDDKKSAFINPILVSAAMSALAGVVAKWNWKSMKEKLTLVND